LMDETAPSLNELYEDFEGLRRRLTLPSKQALGDLEGFLARIAPSRDVVEFAGQPYQSAHRAALWIWDWMTQLVARRVGRDGLDSGFARALELICSRLTRTAEFERLRLRVVMERNQLEKHLSTSLTEAPGILHGDQRSSGGGGGRNGPPDDDETAFVTASTLWPQKYKTYKEFKVAFDKIPEAVIRRRKPSPQRLLIHAGDWVRYWSKFDEQAFEAMDEESLSAERANAAALVRSKRRK
jgi:hypothetical protein